MTTEPKETQTERGGLFVDSTGIGIHVSEAELQRVTALNRTMFVVQSLGAVPMYLGYFE